MIKGNLVTLSKPNREHMPLLSSWRNTPEFRKYYREYRDGNLEDQFHWFDNVLMKDPTWHHFIARPKDNPEKIIGVAFLNHIHPVYRTGEFGITLADENYRGKGYGKDMLLTLMDFGFNQLNLNKIWCEVYSNNSSIHLYRKIGFQDEGLLKQQVFKDGNYLDSHLLGMLHSDYTQRYGVK
jgi:UDP-4-amino-4,6-dideoxy-N-acetyl-beta-L-altrosamine N-acetyltransferase